MMGYAARANKARRVKALQDGTLTQPPSILDKMRPNPQMPSAVAIRLAGMLAIATAASSRPGRGYVPVVMSSRRRSGDGA